MEKRITTITTETHEVFVFRRRPSRPTRAWCGECAADVDMLTPEEITVVTGLNVRAIYRQAEQGRFHFTETAAGFILVCLESLCAQKDGPALTLRKILQKT